MTARVDPQLPPSPPSTITLRVPLVVLGGVLGGMVWARALSLHAWQPVATLILLAVLSTAAARRWPGAMGLGLMLGALALGMALQVPQERQRAAAHRVLDRLVVEAPALVQVSGTLADEPWIGRRGVLVPLAAGSTLGVKGATVALPAPLMVRVALDPDADRTTWRASTVGDRFEALGRLEVLDDEPEPGDFDAWLASQGAPALVVARSASVSPPPAGRGVWPSVRAWAKARANAAEDLFARTNEPAQAALLTSLTLGRTGGLDDKQRDAFRATGLAHLYSVSGLHTATVGVVLMGLAAMLGLGARWRAAFVLVGLSLFCATTGLRTPCLRAALLVTVIVLQGLSWRATDRLASLASVALVLVVARPAAVWQLDFQLSFLCAAVLALSGPVTVWIEQRLGARVGWELAGAAIVAGAKILAVSALIQLVLAPAMLRHFGEVPLVAPLANVVGIPLSGVAMTLGLAAAVAEYFVPMIGEALAIVAGWATWLLDVAMRAMAAGAVSVSVATPWPAWLVAACYALLIAGAWLARRPRPWAGAGIESFARSLAIVALMVMGWSWWGPAPARLAVVFLDVGQGDAILLQSANGTSMLVDTGPPGAGREVVESLRRRGIEHLDVLVLTHADADHIGGAAEVMNALMPRTLVLGGSLSSGDAWREVAEAAATLNTPIRRVARGDQWTLAADVDVEVLHPTPSFLDPGDDRNDASVVLRVICDRVAFLLTGDAEAEVEADLLASVPLGRLRADVLKAGHHGSAGATTTAFLAAVAPQDVVLSVGANNRYGHPAPEVLERLTATSAHIWRTDQQGQVAFTTDGRMLRVATGRRPAELNRR